MSAPVVLVTGALTGIGRATALAFAREGANVVASGRREEEGKKLIVFLASDKAPFITGASIAVDGGKLAK
jgi:NAD(P)-dependent dehydrogenase (short-subunit alcohol dehydrogenase family)